MSDYIAQAETEYLVLIDPVLPPVYMEVGKGAHVATTRIIEAYASAEQAETRMRELVPGWEPLDMESNAERPSLPPLEYLEPLPTQGDEDGHV